ncbi:MAG: hypothetical protein Q7U36_04950 [bacterium]|nr:hypothetical protein [bacterium]
MESWKRKVFFWILVLLFLMTVPVIILNAKGYRFDKNRGVFVHSGTITFKSNPQTVDVKLNNELFESKKLNRINSSFNVSGIVPGEYDVQVSAPDFQTWSKKTQVHSGLASEFWNVLLVRKDYEKTELNTPEIQKFFTSPKNDLLAYITKKENDLTVKIFNIATSLVDQEINFSGWEFIEDTKKENIEWSPDNLFLSVPVKKIIEPTAQKEKTLLVKNPVKKTADETLSEYEYNYFIYDFVNKNNLNLTEILNKKNIHNVRWDPRDSGFLFFLENNILFRADIKNPQDIIQIASDVSSFDLSGSYVYYAQNSGMLYKNSLDGKSEPAQITNNFPGFQNVRISSIVVYDDSRIALILENKDFYIFNKGDYGDYFRKLSNNIEEAHFSDDGKKILFWSNNEISVYFLREQLSQPIRQENEMQNITRYSEPIKNVQWFKDYEHVIFNSGKWIKIIEIDPRDHANCMDLINTETLNPFVIYNSALEKMYFIDTKDAIANLFSITFPEKTTFFGIGG